MQLGAPSRGDGVDLEKYLARIGHEGPLEASAATLARLHRAHVCHVPFENLDVQLGLPIRLDVASLEAKIVDGLRGGYCFEQNALFAAVLRKLGFRVTTLAGRVRSLTGEPTPRTHMLLSVEVDGDTFLADVGFGGDGPILPLRLVPDDVQAQHIDAYRIVREGALHRLDAQRGGDFLPLYTFTLEEHFAVDYELANYFTSTHPSSRFVQALVAARPGEDCRYSLYNREFAVRRRDAIERRTLASDDELFDVLVRYFGLQVDRRSRFRALHGEPRP